MEMQNQTINVHNQAYSIKTVQDRWITQVASQKYIPTRRISVHEAHLFDP